MIQRGIDKKMKDLPDLVQDIVEASRKHEQYRDKECINMIASEGLKSPAVNQMIDLSHDLACRYAEGENDAQGHVKKRYYQGQKYMSEIEDFEKASLSNKRKADSQAIGFRNTQLYPTRSSDEDGSAAEILLHLLQKHYQDEWERKRQKPQPWQRTSWQRRQPCR